jgi:hypothetical protein
MTDEQTFEGYVLKVELEFIANPRGARAISSQAAEVRDAAVAAMRTAVEDAGATVLRTGYGCLPLVPGTDT